jgi:hypothetical protein
MGIAGLASDFRSNAPITCVQDFYQVAAIQRLKKTGPSTTRFIFGIGFKQGGVAANAMKGSHALFIQQRTRPRWFSAGLSSYVKELGV